MLDSGAGKVVFLTDLNAWDDQGDPIVPTPGSDNAVVWENIFHWASGGSSAKVYCTAKVNSLGCTPRIAFAGGASAANKAPFFVTVDQVRNNKPGLFFYRLNGAPATLPFQGGTLCVGPTNIRRTTAFSAGGNPAPANDCSGVFAIDFNAFGAGLLGGNPDPGLGVQGNAYQCQAWGRDQGFPAPNNTTLSDALDVTIGV